MALVGRKKQTPKKARNLDRIRKLISRAEKRGYIFPEELMQDLPTYSTQKLKALTADKLYSMAKAVDKETGEILTGIEYRKRERSLSARLGALTRKAKEAAKKLLGRGKKPEQPGIPDLVLGSAVEPLEPLDDTIIIAYPNHPDEVPPDGGAIINDLPGPVIPGLVLGSGVEPLEPTDGTIPIASPYPPVDVPPDGGAIIFQNVLEEFIERLQEPVPAYGTSARGRSYKRTKDVVNAVERGKEYLLDLVNKVSAEIGSSQLGWRLQQNADTVSACMEYFIYTSDGSAVQTAIATLAAIINGGPLSLAESLDLGMQSEYNEDWDEPD